MKENKVAGETPVLLISTGSINYWEERAVSPASKNKNLGRTVLNCLKQPRLYEYSDAAATIVLALDHLLR